MPTSVNDSDAVLAVRGLEVRYGAATVATGIDLDVYKGEVVALLGPNGAGKTSVLKAIVGLVKPATGSIRFHVDGQAMTTTGFSTERLARLGIVHVPALGIALPRMTVAENLEIGGRFLIRDKREVMRRVTRALDRFPALAQRRGQLASVLSGGEQRQLAIARALICSPKMLVLDEPSIGLAPKTLDEIFGLLKRINSEDGTELLIVEQNVNKALEVADRAYVMRVGAMDFSGPSAEVAANEKLAAAYLGS